MTPPKAALVPDAWRILLNGERYDFTEDRRWAEHYAQRPAEQRFVVVPLFALDNPAFKALVEAAHKVSYGGADRCSQDRAQLDLRAALAPFADQLSGKETI